MTGTGEAGSSSSGLLRVGHQTDVTIHKDSSCAKYCQKTRWQAASSFLQLQSTCQGTGHTHEGRTEQPYANIRGRVKTQTLWTAKRCNGHSGQGSASCVGNQRSQAGAARCVRNAAHSLAIAPKLMQPFRNGTSLRLVSALDRRIYRPAATAGKCGQFCLGSVLHLPPSGILSHTPDGRHRKDESTCCH